MTDNTNDSGTFLITLARPNPENADALAQYSEEAPSLGMQYGMQLIAQFKVVDQIFGEHHAAIVSVVQFPDANAITGMFESEAYQPLIALREQAFTSIHYYISTPDQSLTIDNTEDKTYLLVTATPADKASLGEYQQHMRPMAASYGAQPIINIPIASTYLGEHPSALLSITEFPEPDSIRNFFGADEYQPFLPLREKALSHLNLYIAQ